MHAPALDRLVLRFVERIYGLLYRPRVIFTLLRRLSSAITPTDKAKMERDLARQCTTHSAAVTVFLVGDRRIGLSYESAQYALYNLILHAQVLGIGTRLRGPGPLLLDRSRAARKILSLGQHEHILGMLEMGYPEIQFANKVSGKRLPQTWI